MRQGMWEKVSSRHHKVGSVFPFGLKSNDAMLHGTVGYGLKDGRNVAAIDWAARAHFVKENGVVRMNFYQVYIVSSSKLDVHF
jgi:hypothetical protein